MEKNTKILEQIKKNCAQLLQSLLILTKIEEFIKQLSKTIVDKYLLKCG